MDANAIAQFVIDSSLAAEHERAARAQRRQRASLEQMPVELFSPPLSSKRPPVPSVAGKTITGAEPRIRRLEDDIPHGKAPKAPARAAASSATAGFGGGGGRPSGAPPNAPPGARHPTNAALLAGGHRPAVLKVVSYAHGVARASATAQYAQRDEAHLETHDSRILADKEAAAAEMKVWARSFDRRKESDDVATVRLAIDGLSDSPEDRATLTSAISAAFSGHRHAFRIDVRADGALEARVVAALAGADSERFRLMPEREGSARRFNPKSESAIEARVAAATGVAADRLHVVPGGAGHGVDALRFRLAQLAKQGSAITDRGKPLKSEQDAQGIAALWRRDLRSFKPRDTMHLVLSAKADTDVEAFSRAVRAFLHDEFQNHKFAFAVHTDKAATAGHIHAHAIIAVKGETGERLSPGPAHFRAWRASYAEKAQAEGLRIVATAAMERASSQSYGPRDKAIVDVAERPRPGREERDRVYARYNPHVIDSARRRIQTAHTNPVKLPNTERERAIANGSLRDWRDIAVAQPQNLAAQDNIFRLATASLAGHIIYKLGQRVRDIGQGENMPVSAQKMKDDLRDMNHTVATAAAELTGDTQQQFMERAGRALQTMALRTDLQAAKERGVETVTRAELERIAGPATERLIAHIDRIAAQDATQAAAAEAVANRAVEIERRDSGAAAIDPTSEKQVQADRAFARDAIDTASRERREADAAALAAQQLVAHPAQAIDPNTVQSAELAALKNQQERAVQEIKDAEEAESERQKPTRMR